MTGEYSNAKGHYQQAMDSLMGTPDQELELACRCVCGGGHRPLAGRSLSILGQHNHKMILTSFAADPMAPPCPPLRSEIGRCILHPPLHPPPYLPLRSGIARCTLQLGDIRQGRGMVLQLNSQQLFKECAHILEGLQQLTVGKCDSETHP